MRSFYFWIVTVISLGTVHAAEPITARDATIDNVQLHYLTAGHGPATVILLHGFAETSRMWRPIIPTLAEKFTVIAPDLPGIGDSSIPNKIDMLEAAKKIHALVRSLKIDKTKLDVEVTIGVQRPEQVDLEKVKNSLPVGNVSVKAVKGGLDVADPENNDPAVDGSTGLIA